MKNKLYRTLLVLLFITFTSFAANSEVLSKGISFQGVIKTPSGQFPTISGTTVLVKILSQNDCILREETFNGVNISNGYLNLAIGRGTPTINNPDPARDLKVVMNNAISISSLKCLNPDGSVNSLTTTYNPQPSDVRKLRISMQIDQDNVVADFNMRAVAYAVNAESLNGKSENSFINVNGVEGLTQANAESIFQRFTQLNDILNGSFTGNVSGNLTGNVTGDVSGTSENVRGIVALSHGGTGATDAAGARAALGLKGLAVLDLPTPVDTSKFLRGDGEWAPVVGGVSSVNGKNGVVILTTAELADFNSASDARALGVVNGLKAQANGLATLDAGGKVPSTQLGLTSADIPNIDASKINSGTLTVNVNSTSVNAGTGQFTQLKVNDGTGKVLTMSRQAGGLDYSIQWPANVGSAGSVLQTDASGVLSWVAIPSAPVSSVAGKTGPVTLVKNDIGGLGTAAGLDFGTSAENLVQLDSNAKIPASLLPNSVLTTSSGAGGDLTGTYPNPTVATGAITSSKIADGAVGSLSKVVSSPGSAGTNRLLATDTGTGASIKDFYCTTVGHYLKWTGVSGFGCAAISSADIGDAASANNANTIVKRDPSGNFSAGTVTANLNGNVTGNVTGNLIGKVSGSLQSPVVSKTTNYTILDSDGIITANASTGNLTLTLPSAVGMTGRQYTIKKTDSSSNTVTLSTSSSQNIDGSPTAQLTGQWQYLTVTSDGSNWIITNSTSANAPASVQFTFSDVIGATTNTVITSSPVTTTGSGTLTASVSGSGNPQISINGGSWVTSGSLTAGQTLAVRMTSSGTKGVSQTATVTAGSYSANWSVATAACGTGVLVGNSCIWTSTGSFSFIVPSGVTNLKVTAIGGGAGGGAGGYYLGGGGGSGYYVIQQNYSVTPGATINGTIGSGGGLGSSGGSTTFGSVSVNGGLPGIAYSTATGGNGGNGGGAGYNQSASGGTGSGVPMGAFAGAGGNESPGSSGQGAFTGVGFGAGGGGGAGTSGYNGGCGGKGGSNGGNGGTVGGCGSGGGGGGGLIFSAGVSNPSTTQSTSGRSGAVMVEW